MNAKTVPVTFSPEPALRSERIALADAPLLGALAPYLQNLILASDTENRVDAALALARWIFRPERGLKRGESERRWKSFIELLEAQPELRTETQRAFGQIIAQTEGTNLFATAGLPSDHGLVAELWDRLLLHVLPAPRDDHDLERLLIRLFRRGQGFEHFQEMPVEMFHRLVQLLFPQGNAPDLVPLRQSFADAFRLSAIRVQAHGIRRQLRDRSTVGLVTDSPFYRIVRASEILAEAWLRQEEEAEAEAFQVWSSLVQECRRMLQVISDHLETAGVSVNIVYSMEIVSLSLVRMEHMMEVMTAPEGVLKSAAIHRLFSELVIGTRRDQSLRDLLDSSTRFLHRKIVERAGQTGHHYIVHDAHEYRGMWLAAAGGGFITTFTTALKLRIAELSLPLFVGGLTNGLNYAISFMIMHGFGFVLATKQPAMTAAVLADIVRENRGQKRYDEMAQFSARICHSQIAAALGNISVVSVCAYVLDLGWRFFTSHSYLPLDHADKVLRALSPLDSGTIFFAAFTGVLLWLASLIGGWLENISVYHRLPESIRDHPLRGWLGRERTGRWAKVVEKNIGGWGTNISLGLLLGLVPAFGAFFGLPLEVRHVTLSTGQLALAGAALGPAWLHDGLILRAACGIATMFVLNLSVSFLFSLFTAARAYQLSPHEIGQLLLHIGQHARRHPRDFLLPPRVKKT